MNNRRPTPNWINSRPKSSPSPSATPVWLQRTGEERTAALTLAVGVARDIGRKFEVIDVESDQDFWLAAHVFLDLYLQDVAAGTRRPFSFLDEMATARSKFHDLTWGQVKGVLNCLRADVVRADAATEAAQKPSVEPQASETPEAGSTLLPVPVGTYSVVTSDGDHVTLRLAEATWTGWKDTLVAKFLSGPDNTSQYTGFAFVANGQIKVWKRFQDNSRIVNALTALLTGDFESFGMAYALASGNCYRCNRKLTVPASLHRGLGPTCAGL